MDQYWSFGRLVDWSITVVCNRVVEWQFFSEFFLKKIACVESVVCFVDNVREMVGNRL